MGKGLADCRTANISWRSLWESCRRRRLRGHTGNCLLTVCKEITGPSPACLCRPSLPRGEERAFLHTLRTFLLGKVLIFCEKSGKTVEIEGGM